MEEPVASTNLLFFNFTATLKDGLCLGPVLDINLYIGRILYFFKEYSCNFVLESICVTLDVKIRSFQIFKINFSVKLKLADKPSGSTWPAFYAVSILTGIGFTMSLFVGNLAFANNMEYIDGVKIGVLTGSLLSTLFGYFLLLIFSKK